MTHGIVVINLDRDTARMAHMRCELDRAGVSFERFAALRGDALPFDLSRYFPTGVALSPGEIGCYASHLAIMKQIVRGQRSAPLLVLEDDVGLPADLGSALEKLIAVLPEHWDIVRLSYPTKLVTRPIAALGAGRHLVRYSRVPTTTGAYLISASGARKFLAERPRSVPVDHDLRQVWDWDLNTYGVSPPLIAHDVLGVSSIDTLSPKGRAALQRRQRELRATLARLHQGIRDFGFSRWLALGPLNLAARIAPKRMRPSFVRWANARLA
ncbi:MAG: glycosyltransferase family 25 protein [Alphaproteobacteria bacterium]|nr:glycosyltransferase family 25 protein [Alphaproteobacteria bacterium]